MLFYREYIVPNALYLLLLLGFVAFEAGHGLLHQLDKHHHVHHHSHSHQTKEHHHVHEHIQDFFTVAETPPQLQKQQAGTTFSVPKQINKQVQFFCAKQTAYTFSFACYQLKVFFVVLAPNHPPPQA